MRNIISIYDLYERLRENNQSKDIQEVLYTKSWLYSISDFDPLTGEILPTDLISFLHKIENSNNQEFHKDYIYKIIKHSMEAFYNIIKNPRNKILRHYNSIPIHSVREIDSKTIQWISMQQGRNIREKLSSSKNIKAIQRVQSLNTLENRLMKSLAKEILYLLDLRKNIFPVDSSDFEEFAVIIDGWLHQEDVQEISFWNGLTPNNTLLQDKNYKKIWDSWIWLKNIEEEIKYDFENYHNNLLKVTYWRIISKLHTNYNLEIIQQVISFNYEKFMLTISNGKDLMGMFPHKNINFKSSICQDNLTLEVNKKNY